MNWRDFDDSNYGRGTVALVALAIVVVMAIIAVIIVNVANAVGDSHHKKLAAAATQAAQVVIASTTTTIDPSMTTTTISASGITVPPDDPDFDPNQPEGETYTPAQLAADFPQSQSDLSPSQYQQATTIAANFVTADATGQGADSFNYYYSDGYFNTPWLKNYSLQWVYATEQATNVIHATAWYTGTSLVDGTKVEQATQDIYLDMTKNDNVIHPEIIGDYGITVDPTRCCTNIVDPTEDNNDANGN